MKDDERNCGPKWGWARKKPEAWGGPPWARGGPFGMFAGARPGRMFAQGDLRLLLLALIADKPSHGYDLIRTIEAKFGGTYAPSPGAIYPTLTLLEEQELISADATAPGKKAYAATAKGLAHLEAHGEDVRALMARIDDMAGVQAPGAAMKPVMTAIHALRHAIMARAAGGMSKEEAERIRAVLERAVSDIVSGGRR